MPDRRQHESNRPHNMRRARGYEACLMLGKLSRLLASGKDRVYLHRDCAMPDRDKRASVAPQPSLPFQYSTVPDQDIVAFVDEVTQRVCVLPGLAYAPGVYANRP